MALFTVKVDDPLVCNHGSIKNIILEKITLNKIRQKYQSTNKKSPWKYKRLKFTLTTTDTL